MKRIAVLCHQHDNLSIPYYMSGVIEVLRKEHGWQYQLFQGPPAKSIDADIAWQHCALTKIPHEYSAALERCPIVLNRRLLDISKSSFSAGLLRQADDYDGPVLVKSNLNAGGRLETALARRGLMPEYSKRNLSGYQILPGIESVSADTWADPLRVVERYQPEVAIRMHQGAAEALYCVRLWKFLGSAESHELCYSPNPIVKGRAVVLRKQQGAPPAELRRLRERLQMDFGKIDYGMVGGRAVVYDVNRTPAITRGAADERPKLLAFAGALQEFTNNHGKR